MDFTDLNDEIGADDWLIPKQELTRRRLVKQTPRFKIYKADWFGDVLVYEPIKRHLSSRRQTNKMIVSQATNQEQRREQRNQIDQETFATKLSELRLELRDQENSPTSCQASPTGSLHSSDSAYSSMSSTPQYHTKHSLSREFEFPASQAGPKTLNYLIPRQEMARETPVIGEHGNCNGTTSIMAAHSPHKSTSSCPTSPPVVLNRDSFLFHHCGGNNEDFVSSAERHTETCHAITGSFCVTRTSENELAPTTTGGQIMQVERQELSPASGDGWFELNELRLVAHENFMLFMGASLGETENMDQQNAALVMQMSQPRSVTLHNLLHANSERTLNCTSAGVSPHPRPNFSPSTPADRFFNWRQNSSSGTATARRRHQPLTLEAKLNICQQVTNAMTYLHDKNIVHGRLTSVNIYIELNQRVKISLLDNDEQQIVLSPGDCPTEGQIRWRPEQQQVVVALNLPALTYLSPELIRTLAVAKPTGDEDCAPSRAASCRKLNAQMDTSLITKESDIFSFGTLLFEMFEERFPFATKAPEAGNSPGPLSPIAALRSRLATSPEARQSANAKLFDDLCLESPAALWGRSPKLSPPSGNHHLTGSPSRMSPSQGTVERKLNQGNIKTSASELIYQIGSGQIAERNARDISKCPALVDHIITACWSEEAHARPSFKQLKFEK